jgi:hypothetical protein
MTTETFEGAVTYSADPKGYGHSIGIRGIDGFFNASKSLAQDLSEVTKGDMVKVKAEVKGNKRYVTKFKVLGRATSASNGAAAPHSDKRWQGDWNASLARAIEIVGLQIQSGALKFPANAKSGEKQVLLKEAIDALHAVLYEEVETRPCLRALEAEKEDLHDEQDEREAEEDDDFDDDF